MADLWGPEARERARREAAERRANLRECRMCGEEKPLDQFALNYRCSNFRAHDCRSCLVRRELFRRHGEVVDVPRPRPEPALAIVGRCEHGFVHGLCPMPRCPGATADPAEKKLCRLCHKATRLDRERVCAACNRARRRKSEFREAAETR
jgi:hypothetical protein